MQKKDKYGRALAYVYYYFEPFLEMKILEGWYIEGQQGENRNQQRLFLNATLINAGYAQVMTPASAAAGQAVPPNVQYQELFVNLEKEARDQGRGLWGR